VIEARSRSGSGVMDVAVRSESDVIKVGDQLELSVWGYPEFQTTAVLRESGIISVPLVGDVTAIGLTKQQLINNIRGRLTKFVKGEAEITLNITNPDSRKVSVFGSVTRQDNYPVTGEVSLMEALSSAGGTTPESDLNHVKIIHNGNLNEPVEVDLAKYLESGRLDQVPRVGAGDVVYVPKKENVVRSFSDFLRDAVLLIGTFRIFY